MDLFELVLEDATRDFDRPYRYLPPEKGEPPEIGSLVEIPFGRGNSKRRAYVIAKVQQNEKPDFELKRIERQLTPSLIRDDQIILAREIRRRYFCSLSQALKLMAPVSVIASGGKKQKFVRLQNPEAAAEALELDFRSLKQARVIDYLLETEEAPLSEILEACQISRSVLDTLRKHGWIEFFSKSIKTEIEEGPYFPETAVLELRQEQSEALQRILEGMASGGREELLFGVTGSGKTEVYLRAAEAALQKGRDVVILVPEISLTPLICSRISRRFGDAAAVLHSRLSSAERYEQWRSIRSGEKHLVVGARSAVFAPLADIGLIVIDEEQESSYKSATNPRYDARDIARMRAMLHGASLVLTSATPSLESYYRSESGKSERLLLKERAAGSSLPQTEIIDMRHELAAGNRGFISRRLEEELEACFEAGEQAMLFLNRRGYTSTLICKNCGKVLHCRNCDVSLTEHRSRRSNKSLMVCHYCGHVEPKPERCDNCGEDELEGIGFGTQQLEDYLRSHFPEQRFLRMDQDSTWRRNAHARLLEQFSRHEADVLIGTQMIAKGHDFSGVHLVGILAADQMFQIGGYAAEERGFQLVCQAAGRAGRRTRPGLVLIQAYDCENFSLQAAAAQNYERFYLSEMEKRKIFHYPPCYDLGVILVSSLSETACQKGADEIYRALLSLLRSEKLEKEIELFRPVQAPLAKLQKRWRMRIILKSASKLSLTKILSWLTDQKLRDEIRVICDINPKGLF